MIPGNITRENIISAIGEIDKGREVPERREPDRYHLSYNNKVYPPKFIVSIANKYANGQELDSDEFSGGYETNSFLESRGFKIVPIESIRYDDLLLNYLKSTYHTNIEKLKRSFSPLRIRSINLASQVDSIVFDFVSFLVMHKYVVFSFVQFYVWPRRLGFGKAISRHNDQWDFLCACNNMVGCLCLR